MKQPQQQDGPALSQRVVTIWISDIQTLLPSTITQDYYYCHCCFNFIFNIIINIDAIILTLAVGQ